MTASMPPGVPAGIPLGPHHPPAHAVREAVKRALAEDLTPLGDLSSALLPQAARARAEISSRSAGAIAGTACASETFAQVDADLQVRWHCEEGSRVEAGTLIGEVQGPLASMLTAERTACNFLCHLSGIATLTARFVDAVVEAGSHARIWDTRKTTPGLRALEKAAVRAGGGSNHRGNLSEWVMLKDNHLAELGISMGVELARRRWPGRTVHVECERLEQVEEALAAGADAILLDNMAPEQVSEAVAMRDRSGTRCLLEASGGINLDNVGAYAATGVEMISIGALTISAPVLDIGLDVVSVTSG